MSKSKHYYIRKSHRWLGLVLGVQFFFWTIGGLYFSWTNIDDIHGDGQRRPVPHLQGNVRLAAPELALAGGADSIHSLQLVNVLNKPYYFISYSSKGQKQQVLADAQTGKPRGPITREEAVQISRLHFNGDPKVEKVEYLTSTHGHHEYREKPLPAWAVSFRKPSPTTVYISAGIGRVESFRNNQWRVFDFLWMMHTMDYKERDNINNWLLRLFSVFGLATILSGFVLFWATRRRKRRVGS